MGWSERQSGRGRRAKRGEIVVPPPPPVTSSEEAVRRVRASRAAEDPAALERRAIKALRALEYAGPVPSAAGPHRPITSLRLTMLLASVAGVLYLVGLLILPQFVAIFVDFGVRPTPATLLLIRVTTWINTPRGAAAVWGTVVGLPVLYSLVRPWPPRHTLTRRLGWILFAMLVMGGLVAFLGAALVLPMVQLVEALASGR